MSESLPTEPEFPPTVIIVHPREKRRKCTVEPLRGRAGFQFLKFPAPLEIETERYVRLGLSGPLLGPGDAQHGLVVLDGTWHLAAGMEASCPDLPVRSLPSWKTAYPRSSKLHVDPEQGLATIEAIYLAYRLLGRDTAGLLDHYYWADEFLRLNGCRSEDVK